MSSSGKNKKKSKWKPVALGEVLNTVVRPSQSWADEVEDELNEYTLKKITSINLPTAPRAATDLVIDESKIPPNGPFMAYLSNLPYEITEDDIAQHFSEYKISNIQLPKDSRHDRMKGFGYVEFKDKSSLLLALNEGELTLKSRLVRISLPNDDDQHKDKNSRSGNLSFSRRDVSDRIDGGERNLGEWRAAAPIPHDPDKGFTRPGQRDEPSGGRPFREARAFDPEPSGSFSRGGGGGFRSGERDRDRDRDFDGRSNDRGSNRIFGKKYDRDDRGGGRMSFGRKPFEPRDDKEFIRREPAPIPEKEEPKSRPKLDIQPRTKPLEPNIPEALPSSIFGNAKPVDTLKREMEIEAKLSAATSQPSAPRSRASSPPPVSTPRSNRSRSPSVSSVSSTRRQDNDNTDAAYESHQAVQSDNESKDSTSYSKAEDNSGAKQSEFKEPQPPRTNIWDQRKAKAQAAAAVTDSYVSDASSSVIEKSDACENNSVEVSVENRFQNEDVASGQSQSQHQSQSQSPSGGAESRLTSTSDDIYRRPAPKHNTTSDDDFIRYEPDHFNNPDAPSSQQFSNRGGDRGGRYNDSKFNFGRDRDNRSGRDNRRENRGRRPDNGGQFRRDRDREDNHYGGRSSDSKWSDFRSGRGRSSGPRRGSGFDRERDRDNGFYRGGDSRNNDSGTSFSNRSSNSSSTTNLREDDYARRYEERLSDDVHSKDDERVPKESSESAVDDRLKIAVDDDNANRKTVENGNENGVGVDSSEDAARKSNESISTNDQSELNDNSFSCSKNRKKDKKKKRDGEDSDANDKQKSFKDEKKKSIDNHQINDKANNRNSVKNKDKTTKKNRELRDDTAPLPKAKEEKAPNFHDSNRFLFLDNDD